LAALPPHSGSTSQTAAGAGCVGRQGRNPATKARQLLGAFGTLHIRDDVPAQAKYPPFVAPGDYKVACRFSNGQSSPFPDQSPDVRCVALKFFTNDGIETDLLMTQEGGRSHARNAEQFMKAADVLVDPQVRR